ncbi:hypothetical protein I204_07848 [Kwoniella mangroviensis CBS 8886]|uniref:hypothetical protein n=1 Tax=Kwoniella mangroviensis CBS 8507 TaxID=1296122 RepID=UPI00080CE49A|nr:uncharacterized protein I203_05164 [Kwoniella mangroviensis CBS 8507]OCF65489.1 hypothetical protein I203_05164 [Kwoniella mangroviensis CBS 8507]OCF71785.1 hypothetical protein I204_07848 [Kwoniella mangroviensis CBS 8886]
MKRSSDSTISPRSSKRQASLAAFLKPKNAPSPINTKIHISEGNGQEDKPIVLDDGEKPEPLKSITTLDKGKGKAVDLHQNGTAKSTATDLDLDPAWPPPQHPYHSPPNTTYNHPIVIPPPSPSLQPMRFNLNPKIIHNPTTDLDLVYYKSFIDKSSSKELMSFLLNNLPWYRVKYMVRGMNINTPRYTTVFGKDSTDIPWSGYMKCRPRAIPEVLERLMRKVEQVTSSQFNFCLVNYYSSGNDSISYHSDSESFLGPNPTIASLTLGHPRDFLLRHINHKNHPRTGNSVAVEKFVLEDGDMVVMKGKTQHEWEHSIPKRKSAKGRINITFRKGIVKYATENYYNYNVGKGSLHRWDREKGEMKEVEVSDGGVKS